MCFDCVYRNIIETSHEWIECKCKADNKWHDPCCKECQNYKSKNEEGGEQE